MVFQKYNPFPQSIYENVAFGLRIQGIKKKPILDEAVERSLKLAGLWEEVKDRLDSSGLGLSGGQQQRLCIARTVAVQPKIVLMDEPCSALDPISTTIIEELITQLKEEFTIVIVTHNMQQATRVSDKTAYFYLGELIEMDETIKIFNRPFSQGNRRLYLGPLRLVGKAVFARKVGDRSHSDTLSSALLPCARRAPW